jgi:hypothetical protein
MLARIAAKLMIVAMVGTAWLGSHSGCDTGAMYGSLGGVYDTVGTYYVTDGGYYYDEPAWGGYSYEPGYDWYDGGFYVDAYGY